MWFKNIKLFQLPADFKINDIELENTLKQFEFKPCGSVAPQSVGWTAVLDQDNAALLYGAMGFKMFCLKIEEKVLPTTVVREYALERIKELETMEARKLSNREKASIKDQMYFTLIQQAFCRSNKIYAYFDSAKKWLVINCNNNKKLEIFITYLKKIWPTLEFIPPETRNIPKLMTHWLLSNQYPNAFAIEKNAILEDYKDTTRVVRVKNQDLFNDSIQSLIKDGCVPKQINLTWCDRITFNLNHDLTISSLKYDDKLIESTGDGIAETDAEQFDADFLIMTQTLQALLTELLEQVRPKKNNVNLEPVQSLLACDRKQ